MKNISTKEISIFLAIAFALGITLFLNKAMQPEVPEALKGMGGEFQLQSAKGPVHLSDYRGKAVLLYFGYTHCPDICPTALGTMASTIKMLKDAGEDRVAGLFISLDPRRDTPEVTAKFTSFFDPAITGLTGTPEELEKIARKWRISYSVPDAPADSNYAVEHSTFIYLINQKGEVVDLVDEKSEPTAIANKLLLWMEQEGGLL